MRILIIKTSSLGDVIHMLPAITDATLNRPLLHIDWVVEDPFSAIPAWHPSISGVICVAMRRWKKEWHKYQIWLEIKAVRSILRSQYYDIVIDSQGLLKSALWCKQALGHRVGYDRHSARESIASCFYDRALHVPRGQHAITRNRQLMAHALGYAAPCTPPNYGLSGLAARLPKLAIDLAERIVVGLHGSSKAEKLWPIENWQALARSLMFTGHQLVLPWGNHEEHVRAQEIAGAAPNVTVLPKLGLDALACIVDRADAVVGVDTGLLHLAAALGKPGLALYISTAPALTGAVSDLAAKLPLQNLSGHQELTQDYVIQALAHLLKRF